MIATAPRRSGFLSGNAARSHYTETMVRVPRSKWISVGGRVSAYGQLPVSGSVLSAPSSGRRGLCAEFSDAHGED